VWWPTGHHEQERTEIVTVQSTRQVAMSPTAAGTTFGRLGRLREEEQ